MSIHVSWLTLIQRAALLPFALAMTAVNAQSTPIRAFLDQPWVPFVPLGGFPTSPPWPGPGPYDPAPPGHPVEVTSLLAPSTPTFDRGVTRGAVPQLMDHRLVLRDDGRLAPTFRGGDYARRRCIDPVDFSIVSVGARLTQVRGYDPEAAHDCAYARRSTTVSDTFAFSQPLRRVTTDGWEYEAIEMRLERNGAPWMRYAFGYRMGIVSAKSLWQSDQRSKLPADWPSFGFPDASEEFEIIKLPPPFVEGEVVEYVNAKLAPGSRHGHHFYAASEADKALLDGNSDWVRTGRSFKSGGYVPVCRFFYRPPAGGAPTHFFTADAAECERFKALPGFTYEGTPFRASLPRRSAAGGALPTDPASCPEKTVPLWRYFNQPEGGAYAPNHRYLRNRVAGDEMTLPRPGERPWAAEGIALCVPE